MSRIIFVCMMMMCGLVIAPAQQLESFEVNAQWKDQMRQLAPEHPSITPSSKPRVLLFSLSTGYYHWVIPHTTALMEILAEKSGAYSVDATKDIQAFRKANLARYDAVILNNNCSRAPRRDLFYDVLRADSQRTEEACVQMAARYEQNLLDFVKKGGGLMAIHGGIVMQNNSMEFSRMLGGSFDYHPKPQKIEVKLADPDHRLTKAFEGKSFVHVDEPYVFKNAYFESHFKPLLYMEASEIEGLKNPDRDKVRYVSWIKRYGKGRVFYVSPSHNAQSFEDPRLLQYYLDGVMYVTGHLECDDSPMK